MSTFYLNVPGTISARHIFKMFLNSWGTSHMRHSTVNMASRKIILMWPYLSLNREPRSIFISALINWFISFYLNPVVGTANQKVGFSNLVFSSVWYEFYEIYLYKGTINIFNKTLKISYRAQQNHIYSIDFLSILQISTCYVMQAVHFAQLCNFLKKLWCW